MSEVRQQRAAALGVDQVISAWEAMSDGNPYFAVYYNRNNKVFQWRKDDMEGAKSFLSNNLQALQDSGDNSMYYLNIYDEPSKNYPNSGMVASFPFRLNDYEPYPGRVTGIGTESPALIQFMKDAHKQQMEMQEKILKLQYENQPLDTWDKIGGLLETPGAAQAIVPIIQPVIAGLMGLITKFVGVLPQPSVGSMPVVGIAGPVMSSDQKESLLDQALTRLEKHYDLVELFTMLADFADKNPDTFKSYVNMLKIQS